MVGVVETDSGWRVVFWFHYLMHITVGNTIHGQHLYSTSWWNDLHMALPVFVTERISAQRSTFKKLPAPGRRTNINTKTALKNLKSKLEVLRNSNKNFWVSTLRTCNKGNIKVMENMLDPSHLLVHWLHVMQTVSRGLCVSSWLLHELGLLGGANIDRFCSQTIIKYETFHGMGTYRTWARCSTSYTCFYSPCSR